ncbi:hypothetical protein [Larkinella rosea]|uniref:Uncharacterized protein n=1 Tax=Larkinella rosea TaxID=2025312 RepID=A0A3P1C3W9_9BACT|nr:hypothetical protein [Larkinella rosea]RRB07813.1 hypothetical protein EHT25_08575 [Larkinella rosea]
MGAELGLSTVTMSLENSGLGNDRCSIPALVLTLFGALGVFWFLVSARKNRPIREAIALEEVV